MMPKSGNYFSDEHHAQSMESITFISNKTHRDLAIPAAARIRAIDP